jgi:uncharacterized protein (DUF2267 family)
MEANHVGAILVQDEGELCGIVTDRDLALRVVARGSDPREVPLEQIMTREVAALPVSAEEGRAVDLMRIRHIRRVPVLEDDRVVGLVTLDDLVLESTVDPDRIADIILTQLEDPSALKPAGSIHPERRPRPLGDRHRARAEEKLGRLIHLVQSRTRLPSRELAEIALEVVLVGIVRRITYQEAADMIAQLPSNLQDRLLDLPKGPDKSVTFASIERALVDRLALGADEAFRVACDVGAAIEEVVSAGEIADVRAQLPHDMRRIFSGGRL